MQLQVNGDNIGGVLNRQTIREKIESLDCDGDAFVILQRDDMTYMQTSGCAEQGFALEYQNGSLNEHYSCVDPALDSATVVKAFQDYYMDDDAWRNAHEWRPTNLTTTSNNAVDKRAVAMVILVAILGLALWSVFGSV